MNIYAMSDLHGFTKEVKVPQCDLLLVAGDICADQYKGLWCRKDLGRSMLWFTDNFYPWIKPYLDDGWVKQVYVTWGNHDWITRYESRRFNELDARIQIKIDELAEFGNVKIWFSPWSNPFFNWAWMAEPEVLAQHYAQIPEGTDIIVSHQPPASVVPPIEDFSTGRLERIGSEELDATIFRVKPKAVVCGHIHFNFGIYPIEGTVVYNVSQVNERYQLVNEPVQIFL